MAALWSALWRADRFDYEGELAVHQSASPAATSPRPTPGITSRAIPVSTTAPSAISRATRHSSGRARISRRRAASARGLSPPDEGSATSPAQSLTTRVNGNVEQQHADQRHGDSPIPELIAYASTVTDAETRRRDRHGHARRCGQPPRTAAFHHARKRRRTWRSAGSAPCRTVRWPKRARSGLIARLRHVRRKRNRRPG